MAFKGVVDGFQSDLVFGWACDLDQPGSPGKIDFLVNGTVRTTIQCGVVRKDLASQGVGTGQYGFRFDPAPFLRPGVNRCRVLFAGTKQVLRDGVHDFIMPRSSGDESWAITLDPAVAWSPGELPPAFGRRRDGRPPLHRAHIVGQFNSGTNYLQQLLIANDAKWLRKPDYDMQPKHSPVQVVARLSAGLSEEALGHTLYGVSARNPFHWIAAMKSSPYGCTFDSVAAPFASASFLRLEPWKTKIRRAAGFSEQEWRELHSARNIVDYWNKYHADWLSEGEAAFGSVIMVRYEDGVAHPCEVLRVIRHTIGLPDIERIVVNVGNAKPTHEKSGNFWSAKRKVMMPRYQLALSPEEITFISRQLSKDVCKHLRYAPQLEPRRDAQGKGRRATRS